MTDDEIIDLYLQRQDEAVAQTQARYGARLLALADGILCDHAAAEECENDAYLQTWNAIPPHEPRGYFFAFLARITRHLALDACRRRGRAKRSAVQVELTDELAQCIPAREGDAAARLERAELTACIEAFLRTLPEVQRNVFLRRYWYFDSVSAIAARFSFTESKVKSMLYCTRERLRGQLKQEGYAI